MKFGVHGVFTLNYPQSIRLIDQSHFCIVIVVCKITPPAQEVQLLIPRTYAHVIKGKNLELGE